MSLPDPLQSLRYAFAEHQRVAERALHTQLGDRSRLEAHREELLRFMRNTETHQHLFPIHEFSNMQHEIVRLAGELDQACHRSTDLAEGEPIILVRPEQTGQPGRPRLQIDQAFLRDMEYLSSNTAIARIAKCSPRTIRRRKLDYNMARPGEAVFLHTRGDDGTRTAHLHSTRDRTRFSNITDTELDQIVYRLRLRYAVVGRPHLRGELSRVHKWAPTRRLSAALLRINGAPNPFGRRDIPRQPYHVAGPNSLWHHDGQHGLIRFKIIMHGFCDGHSRTMVGLRASNNNRGETVLEVFLQAAETYGVPSRLRGDHGTENIQVAQWMEDHRGRDRGSYIWGLSVHNTRIERMWYEVTQKFGAKWASFFTELEVHYGLLVERSEHIWLLHHLFLPKINEDAQNWVDAWNHHPLALAHEPFKAPKAIWMAGMVVKGPRGMRYVRRDPPAEDDAGGDPDMYGIDWDVHTDASLMRHHRQHHPGDRNPADNPFNPGSSTRRYNEVIVEPPSCPLLPNQITALDRYIASVVDVNSESMQTRRQVWVVALRAASHLWDARHAPPLAH